MRKIKPRKQSDVKAEMPVMDKYPNFGMGLEHLPEAKKWEVGKMYRISLDLKMTGLTVEETTGKKDWSHAQFDILGLEVLKRPNNKKPTRYA